MNLSEMTPAEIDNILVQAMMERASAEATIESRTRHEEIFQERITLYERMPDRPTENAKFFAQQLEKARNNLSEVQKALSEARETLERTSAVMRETSTEYEKRGRWNRYFLVLNPGGHIHSSMSCTTCFPTTTYAWLPDVAAMKPAELIELAGEKACTVCFPDAPVDVLRRPSKLEAPERKAAREKREAEKADRERIKAEKSITNPDGSVVKLSGKWGEKVRTVATAERILVSNLADKLAIDAGKYGNFNKEFREEKQADNTILLAALAHKFKERLESAGEDENDLLMDYLERAKRKVKRDWK